MRREERGLHGNARLSPETWVGYLSRPGHGHGVQSTIWADPQADGWRGEAFAISASKYTYMRLGARSLTKLC